MHSFPSRDELFCHAAEWFVAAVNHAIAARGVCSVALSGGSTPQGLYHQLTVPPLAAAVDWSKVTFFFSDERTVAPDHADSNFGLAKQWLFDPLQISETQQFRLVGELDLTLATDQATSDLCQHFGSDRNGPPPSLDIVFLGLGSDGHTASLFPHTDGLAVLDRWVIGNFVPKLNSCRLTMTPLLINAARHIVFMTAGADKANAVSAVITGARNTDLYPAQLICPTTGEIHWFVDSTASSLLSTGELPS